MYQINLQHIIQNLSITIIYQIKSHEIFLKFKDHQ